MANLHKHCLKTRLQKPITQGQPPQISPLKNATSEAHYTWPASTSNATRSPLHTASLHLKNVTSTWPASTSKGDFRSLLHMASLPKYCLKTRLQKPITHGQPPQIPPFDFGSPLHMASLYFKMRFWKPITQASLHPQNVTSEAHCASPASINTASKM